MASSDRRDGLIGNTGIKPPCRAATTAAITLSGEQTIDGVAVVTGDRVLVKDQSSAVNNGIYVVDSGAWDRSRDCDGPYDLVTGSLIKVNEGSTNQGFWYLTTSGIIDAGSSSLSFSKASTVLAVVSAYMQGLLDDANAATARTTLGLGSTDYGTVADGTVINVNMGTDFTGNSAGNTDYRNYIMTLTAEGANNIFQANVRSSRVEIQTTAGTTTFAYVDQAHIRLGLAGVGGGNITSARMWEGHFANEGTGVIASAFTFYAQDVDLLSGTGTIDEIAGFRSGNLGHATRITSSAIGFDAANMTGGAPLTVAFRTQMTSGTGKWADYYSGSAPSYYAGRARYNTAAQVSTANGEPFVCINGAAATGLAIVRATNDSGAARFVFLKTRATTADGVTIVQSGDTIGTMLFEATDGSTSRVAALVSAIVDGTPGAADMPGALIFATTTDGGTSTVNRVKIGTQGNVILNHSGSALSTAATGGFTYLPSTAGTPTGVPDVLPTGALPMVIDSTNNRLYFYSTGAWRNAGP